MYVTINRTPNLTLVYWEMIWIAVIVGGIKQSWWLFGAILFAGIVVWSIPIVKTIAAGVLTIFWGVVGYACGTLCGGPDAASNGAAVVICLIFAAVSGSIHFGAIREIKSETK